MIERHHEHSLLRALGLTRKQLRLMLLTEGALLALVSSLIGVALGVLYGRLGAQTILPEQVQTELAIPAVRIALILGAALAAGLLASVLPARRAANTAPAQGLAAN
ncbi:FtsX-like permease family protein [Ornithinimicrobium kibberense]|uniref:FtsX-like permease family protein n=1 Tax=Ornithinimicrobium kibberense TaxID=282060 RepID=UPI0036123E59